jgi:ketol-acid reductoisomerase
MILTPDETHATIYNEEIAQHLTPGKAAGPLIVTNETRTVMRKLLSEIQNGIFARNFIEENKAGRKKFDEVRRQEANLPIEEIGSKLRASMPLSRSSHSQRQ